MILFFRHASIWMLMCWNSWYPIYRKNLWKWKGRWRRFLVSRSKLKKLKAKRRRLLFSSKFQCQVRGLGNLPLYFLITWLMGSEDFRLSAVKNIQVRKKVPQKRIINWHHFEFHEKLPTSWRCVQLFKANTIITHCMTNMEGAIWPSS